MAEDPDPRSPWWTVDQAAAYAQVGKGAIYAAIKQARLRAVRLGRRRELRIHREWIEAWLQAAEVVHTAAPGAPHPFRR